MGGLRAASPQRKITFCGKKGRGAPTKLTSFPPRAPNAGEKNVLLDSYPPPAQKQRNDRYGHVLQRKPAGTAQPEKTQHKKQTQKKHSVAPVIAPGGTVKGRRWRWPLGKERRCLLPVPKKKKGQVVSRIKTFGKGGYVFVEFNGEAKTASRRLQG